MKKILHLLILVTFLAGMLVMSPASHAFSSGADSHCEETIAGDDHHNTQKDKKGDSSSDVPQSDKHCHHHTQIINHSIVSTADISTEEKTYVANTLFVVSSLVYGLKRPPRTIA